MKFNKTRILILGFLLILLMPLHANGALFGFHGITGENPNDVLIGEAQIFVELTEYGADQVIFTFKNMGQQPSSIARVYFDDSLGLFSGIFSINNSEGVLFFEGAKPKNLPGAKPLDFGADFSAGTQSRPPQNGVNPGESLGIIFNLTDGFNFDDVSEALLLSSLRIGIHAIAFQSGGGASFMNDSLPVPLPSSLFLFGTGLLCLLGFRKKL